MHYKALNEAVNLTIEKDIVIDNCTGHRYIGATAADKTITINGIPGNALGCYLDGATIVVNGNGQDAIGDTMNYGNIIVHGNVGDTTGYGMRGGAIFVKGNGGYRVGIHMKEYMEKVPVIVVGGRVGDFLGEYQAGGTIIVFGNNLEAGRPAVGGFCATGMHGGRIYIRSDVKPAHMPKQVICGELGESDLPHIRKYAEQYVGHFGGDVDSLISGHWFKLTPNSKSPYKQLYVNN